MVKALYIISIDVVEHLESLEKSLKEMYRVIKSGGILICVTPRKNVVIAIDFIDRIVMKVLSSIFSLKTQKSIKIKEVFYNKNEIINNIENCGFRILSYKKNCFYPGQDGPGIFGIILKQVYKYRRIFKAFEKFAFILFALIEKFKLFNQKQMIIAVKK